MDSTSTGITPVMPIGGAGDGFGGGNAFFWVFALLVLMNGGGFGWGGGNGSLDATMQRGFDSQNLQAQTRDILSAVNAGTAQSVAATNATFHDNLAAMQGLYNETARDIAALAVGQANTLANQNECCSAQKQLILTTSANTDAQIAAAKYETAMQMAGMEQRITAKMDANEITSLRDKVNELQMAQATAGMLRFPQSWSYGAGPFPPIFGCGCNNI